MHSDDILCASDDVVAREVGGEHVLLHLGTGTYFGLNAVGGRVWQMLEQGDTPISQLCAVIAAEFDAPPETIAQDVAALAQDLIAHDLVTRKAA
jgi:hypothetical protein